MTDSLKESLTLGCVYQSMAKAYFENVTHEVSGDTKRFLNMILNRLNANESDMVARITTPENRTAFIERIRQGDTLQFAHVLMQFLSMNDTQRELAERTVDAILKGEVIEYSEPNY